MLALFTALLAPFFVDWSSYRSAFEQQASRILGQRVEVLGETKVRLLPLPFVSFENISVGQNPDNSAMLSADQFSMDMELMPLLSGDVRIVEMNLLRPSLNLLVDENGQVEWTNPRELPVDPGQVALENLKISNGEIRITGLAAAENLVVEQIDATISAQSLFGPWKAQAEGFVGDTKTRFDLSTGRYQDVGQIRVRLDVDSDALPYELQADGQMRLVESLVNWSGKFSIFPTKNASGSEPLPINVDGLFNASPKRVELNEYTLDIGAVDDPYTIKGAGHIDISEEVSFFANAKGRQVNVDRMIANENQQLTSKDEAQGWSLSKRLEFAKSVLRKIPVPPINGKIELDLPAIVAGDTTIRQVRAVAAPQGKQWKLETASATLPGNTKVELSGSVRASPFAFEGDALVASRQPSGLASWLGSNDSQFVRKLNAAGFSGKLDIDDTKVFVENLELVLGENTLTGRVERTHNATEQNGSKQNRLVAELSGKRIDIDELRALYAVLDEQKEGKLASHDLDIELQADSLRVDGLHAQGVDTKFSIEGGSLSLERLNAQNAFGAKVRSSGKVENLLSIPDGDFQLHIEAADPAELFAVLNTRVPAITNHIAIFKNPTMATDLVADFTIKATTSQSDALSRGNATLSGEMGGSQFSMDGEFEGNLEASNFSNFDVSWRVENIEGATLLRQLGLPVATSAKGPENLQLAGKFNGNVRDGSDVLVTALSENSSYSSKGRIQFSDKLTAKRLVKSGEMQINIASRDLAEIAPLSDAGSHLHNKGLLASSGFFEGIGKLESENGWSLVGNGELGPTPYTLDLKSKQVAGNITGIEGSVAAKTLSLDVLKALLLPTVGENEDAAKAGIWSDSAFDRPLLGGSNINLDMKFETLRADGSAKASNLDFELATNERGIFLNGVKAETLDGELNGNASVSNKLGVGTISAQFALENADAKKLADLLDQRFEFSGRIDVNGSIDGAGVSTKQIVAGLSGSGTAEISNGKINAFNIDPLPMIFRSVDVEDFKIEDGTVEPLLRQNMHNGSFEVGKITAPYLIAAGKLSARNIEALQGDVTTTSQYELDLQNMAGELRYNVRYDPGREWVDGVEPEVSGIVKKSADEDSHSLDVQGLSGYLSLRRFEQEQRKVDLLQASILEKQRLRSDILLTNARVRFRKQVAERAERRRRQALLQKMEDRFRKVAAERHLVLLSQEKLAKEEAERKLREEAEQKRKAEEARLAALEAERLRVLEEERIAAEKEAEEKRRQEAAREAALKAQREEAMRKEEARLAQEEKDKAAAAKAEQEEQARQAREAEAATKKKPTLLDLFEKRRNERENNQLPADFGKRLNDFLNDR